MAPSGPRAQRNARGATPSNKTTGRPSGIKKRGGGGPTKADRDGDLDMDAPAAGGGPGRGARQPKNNKSDAPPSGPRRSTRNAPSSNRGPKPARAADMVKKIIEGSSGNMSSRIAAGIDASTRHTRSSRPINGANIATLRIGGLKDSKAANNEGGGLRELIIFVERKASVVGKLARSVRVKKSSIRGDFVYITATKEDAEEIQKLNNFDFAGARLTIEEVTEETAAPLSDKSQQIKEQLKSVLAVRYNQEAKLLDLSYLSQDPTLQQMDMFTQATPEKLFKAFMVIMDDTFKGLVAKREGVVSISLKGNNIDDVAQVMSLADTFPDLINLDLSENQFKDIKTMRKWSGRLRRLETLLLNDNPIAANQSSVAEFMKWWPRLQNLSNIQVRSKEEVENAAQGPKVFPIPQSGSDFRDVNRIGEAFITEFFGMYDNDRQTLAAKYYDEQSVFSFSVMTAQSHIPGSSVTWTDYIKLSRNHIKITTQHARFQRLFVGTGLVQNAWAKFPPTRHPALATEFDKYIIDCHPMTNLADPTGQSPGGVDGMIITMHGEFEDQEVSTQKTARRSFSRTFILGPGLPGRNDIRVVSDLLQLRAYAPLPSQTGAADVPAAPIAAPAAAPVVGAVPQQEQMIIELCKQTGMTPEYSKMCLETAGWNFDQALLTFNEKRATLPPDAFAQQPM
ncbi:mRNA export factor mex67 [Pestalotiopsis sp. NC0098]|nr:mRNA export factor mex67 [Pestalotiopsis sp. NC0098]